MQTPNSTFMFDGGVIGCGIRWPNEIEAKDYAGVFGLTLHELDSKKKPGEPVQLEEWGRAKEKRATLALLFRHSRSIYVLIEWLSEVYHQMQMFENEGTLRINDEPATVEDIVALGRKLDEEDGGYPSPLGTEVDYVIDDSFMASATIVGYVEGWIELRFADESTAIVRPSRVKRKTNEQNNGCRGGYAHGAGLCSCHDEPDDD